MNRSHILTLLALVLVVPAAGFGAKSLLRAEDAPCFSAGHIGYRLSARANADYTVRIDNAAARPDLTLRLVDDPDVADFVLADGAATPGECRGAHGIRTIRLDPHAAEPDLTIALRRDGGARYSIYAHSAAFSAQDAAALFAVMVQARRRSAGLRRLAPHHDDVTGALSAPRTSADAESQ